MKCPKCAGEVERSKTYCPHCGAQLTRHDNSNDDTVRLPDLSGVPLGEPSSRRSAPSENRGSSPAKAIIALCVIIAAAALAVCLALVMSSNRADFSADEPISDEDYSAEGFEDEITVPDDFALPDEDEGAPEDEDEAAEPEESPTENESEENQIIAEDVTPPPKDEQTDESADEPADESSQGEPSQENPEPSHEANTSSSTADFEDE